jgi:hypothetical protein
MVVIGPADNPRWGGLLEHHWPRIYRFLRDCRRVEYHFRNLALEDRLRGIWAMHYNLSDTSTALAFHPALEEIDHPSLLIGTLAHEGLHAICFAQPDGRGYFLPAKQTRRLIKKHWTSRRPPGYGARLKAIHERHARPGETGIELLTNKLLGDRDLDPLIRTLPNGDYDGVIYPVSSP